MPLKIAAVSYLNTIPFLHGLKQSEVVKDCLLSLVPPAECAKLLETGEVTIALTPVAIIPQLNKYRIISDYCIGAVRPVRTVVLLSNTPLEAIRSIFLDEHSRTSVLLVRLLAEHYWRITPAYKPLADARFPLLAGEGCVMIGDKVFLNEQHYAYRYDLAEAWIQLTGQPFVFAAWISRQELPARFLEQFNNALRYGISHIPAAIAAEAAGFNPEMALKYLTFNIDYAFDKEKQAGLNTFLAYIKTPLTTPQLQ